MSGRERLAEQTMKLVQRILLFWDITHLSSPVFLCVDFAMSISKLEQSLPEIHANLMTVPTNVELSPKASTCVTSFSTKIKMYCRCEEKKTLDSNVPVAIKSSTCSSSTKFVSYKKNCTIRKQSDTSQRVHDFHKIFVPIHRHRHCD